MGNISSRHLFSYDNLIPLLLLMLRSFQYSRSVNNNNDNDNDNDNYNYNDNNNSNTNNVLLSSYKCIQWIFTLLLRQSKLFVV